MFETDIKECLFFDAGNTLIHLYPSREEILLDLLKSFDIRRTLGEAKVAFLVNEDILSTRGLTIMPKEEREKLWRSYAMNILGSIGAKGERLEEISGELVSRFRDPGSWREYPDVKPTLEALKEEGCRLGVITNSERTLRDTLRDRDLLDYLDALIISEEMNAEKPDPSIFNAALERVGLPPESCVHVGNLMEVDVRGARQVGMTPVWLDRERLGKQTSDMLRINSLSDLLFLFRFPQSDHHFPDRDIGP